MYPSPSIFGWKMSTESPTAVFAGCWKYTTFEMAGRLRSPCETDGLAKMILVVEPCLPGWDGVWSLVLFDNRFGQWSEITLSDHCRDVIFHGARATNIPTAHFYMYAGGRFRAGTNGTPATIDFQQHWGGEDLPSLQLGIYRLEGEHLYLCVGGSGNSRPTTFSGGQHDQSYGQLIRSYG